MRRGLTAGAHADREALRGSKRAFRGRLSEERDAMERFRCFGLLDGRLLRTVQAAPIIVTLAFAGLPIAAASQTTPRDAQKEASVAA